MIHKYYNISHTMGTFLPVKARSEIEQSKVYQPAMLPLHTETVLEAAAAVAAAAAAAAAAHQLERWPGNRTGNRKVSGRFNAHWCLVVVAPLGKELYHSSLLCIRLY